MADTRVAAWYGYARKASRFRRERGAFALCGCVLRRLVSPVVEWGAITAFEHRADGASRSSRSMGDEAIAIRVVSEEEIEAIAAGLDPHRPIDELRARFRRGDRAFAAFDRLGRVVHVRWVSTAATPIPEIGCAIVPGADQAYFYDGHTRADRRGHGIDGHVRQAIFNTLAAEGRTRVFSYARHDNPVAMRAAARWQRAVGTVRYLRVGRCQPLLIGRATAAPSLVRLDRHAGDEAARRAAWRRWFESWLDAPLEQRSTGCGALPEAGFHSAAHYIVSTLGIHERDRVLDVGCDSAMVSRHVMPHGGRFLGIDFVAGMLRDSRRLHLRVADGGAPWLVSGDGKALPIRSGSCTKAYCSAVIHTLPAHADGLAIIEELIRVTASGGRVLVSSVPDRGRRAAGRWRIWKQASWAGKLTLPLRWLLPAAVRRTARRLSGVTSTEIPGFLEYDLQAIASALRSRGLGCEVQRFPSDYWSADFRETRANLIIDVP